MYSDHRRALDLGPIHSVPGLVPRHRAGVRTSGSSVQWWESKQTNGSDFVPDLQMMTGSKEKEYMTSFTPKHASNLVVQL